jgi:hypothetical protein
MSEVLSGSEHEGLTNFDHRIKCNIILLWSAITSTIWSTPGYIFSTITGQKPQNSDGSSSNPIASAFGSIFGGSESGSSTKSTKKSMAPSGLPMAMPQMRQPSFGNQSGGSNNAMASTANDTRIRNEAIEQAKKNRDLVAINNSGKARQN